MAEQHLSDAQNHEISLIGPPNIDNMVLQPLDMFRLQASEHAIVYPALELQALDFSDSRLRGAAATAGLVAVALTLGVNSGLGAEPALAAPNKEMARSKTVEVPKIMRGTSVPDAFKSLRSAGLRAAGVQPGSRYPKADPGKHFEARGFSERIIKKVRRGGKLIKRTRYKSVRAGVEKPRGKALFVVARQIPNGVNPNRGGLPVATTPGSPDTGGLIPEAPKTIDLKAETEKFLQNDTIRIPFMNNCSGSFVYDDNDKPIGFSSAQHCGLRPEMLQRVRGSDGELYASVNVSPAVQQGEDVNHMSNVATVKQMILPKEGNIENDLALGVFEGSTPQQVLDAYRKSRAAQADLVAGSQWYVSGFPSAQPKNPTNITRRQIMTSTYIGPATIRTANGQVIPAQAVGMSANADGAICSFGNSGAEAVLPKIITDASGGQKVIFKKLGVDAGYDDFRSGSDNTVDYPDPLDGPAIRRERTAQSGYTELNNYDSWCLFDGKTLDIASADVVTLVGPGTQVQSIGVSPDQNRRIEQNQPDVDDLRSPQVVKVVN